MIRLILAALLLSSADAVLAQATGVKKPWEWTNDERIAVRSDPAKARDRIAAMRARGSEAPGVGTADGKTQSLDGDFIDGGVNPELLFPHELFRAWIKSMLNEHATQEYLDATWGGTLHERGFPEDTGIRLARMTASYRSVVLRNRELAHRIAQLSPADQEKTADERIAAAIAECRALHAALEEAEAEFGKERLLRLLYERVVQGYGIGSAGVQKAEVLRYRARGCP